MEIWHDIKDYEGLYQVSSLGRIKSLDKVDSRGHHHKGKILKQYLRPNGYLRLGLCKNGEKKYALVHQLVGQTFIPNPNDFSQVNHKDEDKTNNRVENLEWCNSKYNNNYGTRTQRASKPVVAINLKTGGKMKFGSVTNAAKELSLRYQNISKVLHGKCKSTGNYTFKFVS